MGSNSHGSGKQEARSAEQASNRSPKNVQDAALTYVKELRKAGRERPEVTRLTRSVQPVLGSNKPSRTDRAANVRRKTSKTLL